jgi:hypothetical protein
VAVTPCPVNRTERKIKMKNRLLRASTTLTVLALLVASGLPGAAQQLPSRQQQPADREEERKIAVMPPQELRPEVVAVKVPQECERIRPEVQMHDGPDNFKPPGNPVTLNPALTNWLNAHNFSWKGYDDPRVNIFFADSFRLRSCRVCYATLEVGVRHYQDVWGNDGISIGAAPFDTSPGVRIVNAAVWNPATPNPKTLTFALSAAALNSLLMTGPMPPWLDVAAQDDTDFDYAKLSVWYY